MFAPQRSIQGSPPEALGDLRALISPYPEALHGDTRELARLFRCPESEVEEARRRLLEDGLEVRV
jgi:hypothetical protein